MTIISLVANLECDECGKPFSIRLDPADSFSDGDCMAGVIEDELRFGTDALPEKGKHVSLGACSWENGKMLCPVCTEEKDDEHGSTVR